MILSLTRTVPVLFLALASHPLLAAQNCGNQNLKGAYGALSTGNLVSAPLPAVLLGPSARLGHLEVDGQGNAKIAVTVSFNGNVFDEEYAGNYHVNPDCTMSMVLQVPFPGLSDLVPLTFSGVLSDEDRQLNLLIIDPPGAEIRIVLRWQGRTSCSGNDLKGGYALNLSGVNVFQPSVLTGVFGRVGRVVFDGNGEFTANTRVSYNGFIAAEAFSGTYTVDSACHLEMHYTYGQPFTLVGSVTDNASAAYLVMSAPQGAVISGTLTQQ